LEPINYDIFERLSSGAIATLNDCGVFAMKPLVSRRRIDGLKTLAYDCGLTAEDAKPFGKLSKTSTWEALLDSHGLEFERRSESKNNTASPLDTSGWANDASFPVCGFKQEEYHPTHFLEWVDFSQLLALCLATLGVFVLLMSAHKYINPLNLFPSPVRITIQVGK
jgi:hypothetical protein